jgi:hypothetical protein
MLNSTASQRIARKRVIHIVRRLGNFDDGISENTLTVVRHQTLRTQNFSSTSVPVTLIYFRIYGRANSMTTSTIIHVGEDICYRIPIMEGAGHRVIRTACSVDSVKNTLSVCTHINAIVFDICKDFEAITSTARARSTAGLILFRSSFVNVDETLFDVVVPAQTSPSIWLKSLEELIDDSRRLCKRSEQLRQESADARSVSRNLRQVSANNRSLHLNTNALWREETK